MTKRKTNAITDQPAEAVQEAVATVTEAVKKPAVKKPADSAEAFGVRPSETVSIIAGNRVLFLGAGLKEITIKR